VPDAPTRDQPAIPSGAAAAAWFAAWPLGDVFITAAVLGAVGADFDNLTTGEMALGRLAGWAVFVAVLVFTSRAVGTRDLRADYGVRIRPVDLLGLPAGIALQLAVLPALYWPLAKLWPDTFDSTDVEQRARDLVDRATGAWILVLVAIVVVGAPIVEEWVYRGLLQRSLGARLGRWVAWVLVSAWFALIHFAPVEYPGLFVAGLLFGLGVVLTGRIGFGLAAHLGFNAAGVAVVLWW